MIDFSKLEGIKEHQEVLLRVRTEGPFDRFVRELFDGKHNRLAESWGINLDITGEKK